MMTSSSNHVTICGLSFTFSRSAIFVEIFLHVFLTAGLPLHFVIEPQSAFQSEGSAMTLDCATEPGNADIRWIFNGSLTVTDEQEARGINWSRLTLISTKKTGFFYCVANNSDGAIRSLPASVSSAYLSDFSVGLVNRTIEVIARNTAVVPCATPTGLPSTVTEFEVNSTRLIPSARHLILPSGNLQISNVKMEDSGLYRCVAINPLTNERHSSPTTVTLKVAEVARLARPQFTWTPHSHLEVVEGQNLTLECAAEGWPVPPLSWKRYGGVLPEDRSMTVWGNLMINDVKKSDEGTYICRVEVNATHSLDFIAFIDVLEPPTVTLSSSDLNVTQFDSVTLVCRATGSPKISISWYHNALPVVTSQQVVVSSNGSLTLHNVQLRHSGMYQCFGENSVGVAYASVRLTIVARETYVDLDSVLHDEMQNVAPNGDRVSSGPHTSGTRKLKKLPKNSSSRPPPTFAPDTVTDTADSSKDQVEEEAGGVPATLLPPSKPTVTKTSDVSVLLNWTVVQNGSLPVVFFKVQYKEIADSKKSRWKTLDEEIPPLSRSYEVFLKSGAVYQFRIAAVYSNHDNKIGPISDRVVLKTGPPSSGRSRAPVSSPMIVDVRENVTSFIIFWQYQPTERVLVDGFKIFYKPYDDDVDYQSVKVMGSGSRKATIADLRPDTSYSLRMSCFNSDGESNSSLSVARKTLGLFGSTVTPLNKNELLEPADDGQLMTTVVVRNYHATGHINTYASNELLFIVLGVVLGVMMLVLCVVMVMCACKQHQQRRLMAALDGRRKFHDPSKTIYIGSQIKSAAEGNFLLNGVGAGPKKATTNGYLNVRGNGVAPGDGQPASEYELSSSARVETTEEVPLGMDQHLSEYDDCDGMQPSRVLPLTDERQTVPSGRGAVIYRPPEDLPTISRPRDVPAQQQSLKSSRSSCDYRLHGNDDGESYPTVQAAASPDHIPRLHECQLLYRSPEHTRRSRDRTRGRNEQVSDRSLSASSQVSGSHLRLGKHSNPASVEIEPRKVVGHSKATSILPVDLHSSGADGHLDDGADAVNDFVRLAESNTIPVTSRIYPDDPSSQSHSDSRNDSDCFETVEHDPALHCKTCDDY